MGDGPTPLSDKVRRHMSRMPRRDTGPEIELRRALHRSGLRFRVAHRGLPGTPDIAFTRARVAVFVDGCFWHNCPLHGVIPKNNAAWWSDKLEATKERDARKDRQLKEIGWISVHVWEHEPPAEAADRIESIWRSRRA